VLEAIAAIHGESKATYGWPRIDAELRHRGVWVSRKRVARLMRQAGLSGMVRRRNGKTRSACPASPRRPISCAATSPRQRRTGSGWRT
jgi:transposase InsO family protein